MDTIAYRYSADANPDAAFIPGVPLRDLTVADFQSLTEYQRAGVRDCRFYVAETGADEPAAPPVEPSHERAAPPAAVVVARRRAVEPSEIKDATEG